MTPVATSTPEEKKTATPPPRKALSFALPATQQRPTPAPALPSKTESHSSTAANTPKKAALPPTLSPTAPAPAVVRPAEVMPLQAIYGNAAIAKAAVAGQVALGPATHIPAAQGPATPVVQGAPPAVLPAATGEKQPSGPAAPPLPLAEKATPVSTAPATAGAAGAAAPATTPSTAGAATHAATGATAGSKPASHAAAPSAGAAGAPAKGLRAMLTPGKTEKHSEDPKGEKGGAHKAAPTHEGKATAASPHADPAFQAVVQHAKTVAHHQATHAPVAAKVAEAHGAAAGPTNEVSSAAAAKQTDVMDQQQPKPFNAAAFKAALQKKIAETAPKTLGEADEFKKENKLAGVKGDLTSQVKQEKDNAAGGIEEKTKEQPDTSGIQPKQVTPLLPADTGQAPEIPAAGAAPKPQSDADVSLQQGPKELDKQMSDAGVTDEQLQHSNEPAFQGAVTQKTNAEQQSAQAPQDFRKQEQGMLAAARTDAQSIASKDVAAIHASRKGAVTGVVGHQAESKAEEEKKRADVSAHIEQIYESTKTEVNKRLKQLDDDVNKAFDDGATAAQKAFEDHVGQRMDDYKFHRYLMIPGGLLLWAKDKIFNLPDEVNIFYQEGHDRYIAQMDGVINHVAVMVETGLNDAKGIISRGKKEIQTYVQGLAPNLQEVGKKAAAGVQVKFAALEQSVNEKQGQLVDSLAKKYNDNLAKVNSRIEEMKAENRGLVDAAKDAIKGVIQTIIDLKNMLLNVFSRAAAAIDLVIADPIAFLGHLIDAGKLGFNNFADHILEHLKKGFMEWLFGAVAEIGITLPDNFDLPGILSLVLQVLGLTYSNIRSRAVKILGEKVVKALETAAEIFKILITKGPAGLWEYIKEKIGDLKAMVVEKIKSFILEKVVVAGITWIIGLLNPASAFVKACKAIYDIVMFFVEHGKQIIDLVNAIIDSITSIAKGAIGAAAAFVEKSLAKTIPVVIGFLAALLGVGGISEKIKEIINAIREPINAAIDWVINKAVGLVKAIGGLLGFGKEKDEKPGPAKELGGIHTAAQQAVHTRLGDDATVEKAESVLPEILRELQPMGLKSLTLGPPDADGGREILAEASPRERVAALKVKTITVAISAKINVKGEPVLTGMLHGPQLERSSGGAEKLWPAETLSFAEFHESQKEGLGGTGRAGALPPVPQPPHTPAKSGDQPSAGLIVEPEAGSRELEILAWNTSQPERGHNVSHAEKQFVEWFEGRPHAWLQRVVSVHVDVEGRPVCDQCMEDLNGLRKRFGWVSFSWTGAPKKESEALEVV